MENKVPLRKMEIYQTDDGRRIEAYSHVKDIELVKDSADTEGVATTEGFSKEPFVFVGVVHVGTPVGPKEIKFEITNAKTIEEAFLKYYDFAQEAAESLMKRIEDAQRQMKSGILVPESAAPNKSIIVLLQY